MGNFNGMKLYLQQWWLNDAEPIWGYFLVYAVRSPEDAFRYRRMAQYCLFVCLSGLLNLISPVFQFKRKLTVDNELINPLFYLSNYALLQRVHLGRLSLNVRSYGVRLTAVYWDLFTLWSLSEKVSARKPTSTVKKKMYLSLEILRNIHL